MEAGELHSPELPFLRDHGVTLNDGSLVLRPLTEADWPILLPWNNDPEVLYYTEGDDVTERSLDEVQAIWRSVGRSAFCFIMEVEGRPVGEGWLQRMNVDRLLRAFGGLDCRRIDLCIGEREFWNKGVGTRAIRLLSRFGFERERADAIFGLVGGHNPRSRRAFEKAGYRLHGEVPEPPGAKAAGSWDLILTRKDYEGLKA